MNRKQLEQVLAMCEAISYLCKEGKNTTYKSMVERVENLLNEWQKEEKEKEIIRMIDYFKMIFEPTVVEDKKDLVRRAKGQVKSLKKEILVELDVYYY